MWDDPIVAEVRAVREKLAARFNCDIHAIFKDLQERQIKLGDRLVRRERQPFKSNNNTSVQENSFLHAGR